ncbi:MAG: serine protease, partial [Aestuariivirga sp.]
MRFFVGFVIVLSVLAGPAWADQTSVPQNRAEILMSFAPLVKRTAPAVVNVYAKTVARQQQTSPFEDPIFKQLFPQLQLGPP